MKELKHNQNKVLISNNVPRAQKYSELMHLGEILKKLYKKTFR